MLSRNIKLPILVSIALYGFSYLLVILFTLGQSTAVKLVSGVEFETKVVSLGLFTGLIILLKDIIYYLVMKNYKGNSRKTVEIIMLIVHFVIGALEYVSSYLFLTLYARQGVETLGMVSSLSQVIGLFTAPFNSVAFVLMIIAIARYGISDIAMDDRNSLSIEP